MLVGRAFAGGAGVKLQADAGAVSNSVVDNNFPDAEATVTWYQVGDASGRGGEVWEDLSFSGEAKIGDWVVPNNASSDLYIQFSNLVGDTPNDWSTAWQKIGGSGSANVSLTLGAGPPDDFDTATFDVSLGTNGTTASEGPESWTLRADAR